VAFEIVLDTSGSMSQRLGGRPRIELAKGVLAQLVERHLAAGTPLAVRVLGDRTQPCATRLAVPLAPLDAEAVLGRVRPITVDAEADTPLGAAIAAVPGDLADAVGTKVVVIITDSEERWPHRDLCGEDPAKSIRSLRREGIDAQVSVIGLAIRDRAARRQMREWARLGRGAYYDAKSGAQLGKALASAASTPFRVLDATGNDIARGTVGGAPVEVAPGSYSVVVQTSPVTRFDDVAVRPGRNVRLALEASPG
jgi:uncharacterized protein (DUF58 family)